MKDFLEIVVRQLVDHPEQVVVEEEETERGITYKVNVAEEDKGQVIGKEGKIAKALRTVKKAASSNMPKMVFVDIV